MIAPLIQNALQPFEHLSGMIISNSWALQTHEDDVTHVVNGNVAIRRIFPFGTFRETLIILRDKRARNGVREMVCRRIGVA